MGYPLESQISTAKITGAFAHELCNPLQGVRSLIEVIHRTKAHEADLSRKLERVEDGMNRLAGILDAFRVTYENLPRPADHVSVDNFVSEISNAILRCGATLSREDDYSNETHVYALAPELQH
jgi:nitrogen-specific signal transduction histidine kinase